MNLANRYLYLVSQKIVRQRWPAKDQRQNLGNPSGLAA